jgi:hypothetical protein
LPSYSSDTFLIGCEENCRVQSAPKEQLSFQMTILPVIGQLVGQREIGAGISFGAPDSFLVTSSFYALTISNNGQIRLRYSALDEDLFNDVSKTYKTYEGGIVTLQLDIYKSQCPNNVPVCGFLFANGKPVMKAPIALPNSVDGYIGIYAITVGSSGYTRIINFKSVKVWANP